VVSILESSERLVFTLARGFMDDFSFFLGAFARIAVELGLDVISDPLLVPPFHRQNCQAVEIDTVMEMIAGGESGLAGLADLLLLLDRVADFDLNGTQVRIQGKQAEAVVDDHGVAIDAEIAGESDNAAVGRLGGLVLGDRKIIT
jgi:hypothetical protein